ncbi:glycosyltransferase [Candidatus Microgenomates bacterium]|nr:MAG: glycosyltransferase [Candidatus Microgenomates bacterium]
MKPKLSLPERKRIVLRLITKKRSIARISRETGVSRVTLHKWLKRFEETNGFRNLAKKHKSASILRASVSPRKGIISKRPLYPVIIRIRAINDVTRHKKSVSVVCKQLNISKTIYYRWLKKYKTAGLVATDKDAVGPAIASFNEHAALAALEDKQRVITRYAGQASAETEQMVLAKVAENPELSVHRLVKVVPHVNGKPVISTHGIQNILRRQNLNTLSKRQLYAATQQRPSLAQPTAPTTSQTAFNIKSVFEAFTPSRAPAPPPGITTTPISSETYQPLSRKILLKIAFQLVAAGIKKYLSLPFKLQKPWQSTLVAFSIPVILSVFLLGIYNYALIFISAPNLAVSLGYLFASLALLFGTFFFLYSFKYYISILLVLAYSRYSLTREGDKIISLDDTASPISKASLLPDVSNVRLNRKPFVSIHLPMYNEKRVVNRLLEAVTSLNYENYEVIVCDDSTDETKDIVLEWKNHPRIKILHRNTREGYKGAALQEALTVMDKRTEFVMVFDADFLPFSDSIEQFLKYFKAVVGSLDHEKYSKSTIAAIQGYQWHVLNKSENWITRGVRTEYAGSYIIERSSEEIYGGLKQIAGSVYMIRADLLKQFGWGRSITEDFELTLRLYAQGYRIVYTPYIQAPAEAVSTIKRLIRQRMRWAEGHSHNVKRMFGTIMTSNINSPAEKFEFAYLTPYYLQSFFFLLGTLFWFTSEVVFQTRLPFWTAVWGWSLVLTNLISLPLMNLVGLFLEEAEEKDFLGLLSFIGLTYVVAPFQAYAAVRGFLQSDEGPWFRTPKTGRITDAFGKSRFTAWINWIFGKQTEVGMQHSTRYLPNFAMPTFEVPNRKRMRAALRVAIAFLLIITLNISYLASTIQLAVPSMSSRLAFGAEPEVVSSDTTTELAMPLSPLTDEVATPKLPKPAPSLTQDTGAYAENKNMLAGDDYVLGLSSHTYDFGMSEQPTFSLLNAQIARNWWQRLPLIGRFFPTHQPQAVDVKVSDLDNETVLAYSQPTDETQISIPTGSLMPGTYTLTITDPNTGKSLMQDFSWGVLSMNTDQATYVPGQDIHLTFAVLDSRGKMDCEADLTLYIHEPGGATSILSTSDGSIIRNSACTQKVTDQPDYEATVTASTTGIYTMELFASTKSGIRTLQDSFIVVENSPFIINRTTPTRIYPQNVQPVSVKVIATQDFRGTIIEEVPESFVITPVDGAPTFTLVDQERNARSQLVWEVDIKAGEIISLAYSYDAPNKSPYSYALGPLTFHSGQVLVFEEERQWQIAVDVALEYYVARADAQVAEAITAWTVITGTAESGTTASTNGWIDSTNLTTGEDYLVMVWGYHNINNTNQQSGMRVTHGGTAFAESQAVEEADRTGPEYKTPYYWFTVWTAVSGEDLEVEHYGSSASYDSRTQDINMIAINAEDLVTDGNLVYHIQTTEVLPALTTTPTAKATITWTPANAGDTWWIGAYSKGVIQTITGDAFNAQLDIDSGTIRSAQSIDGEDTTDTPVYGLGWAQTFTAAQHTVELELSESVGDQSWAGAGVFALRLNTFEDFSINATSGNQALSAGTNSYNQIATITDTPTTTGFWVVSGGFVNNLQADDARVRARIQQDNTTDITAEQGGYDQGLSDKVPHTAMDIKSYNASTSYTWDLDARETLAATDANAVDAWMVAFSTELAATGVTLSGKIYTDAGSSLMDCTTPKTVNLRVNGAGTYSTSCSNSPTNGSWSISDVTVSSGQVVTVYIDDATSEEATTVMISDATAKTDINLYQNYVIVRDDVGSSITPDNLYAGHDTDDDNKYSVSAASNGNLSVNNGFQLFVWAGDTFDSSGGTVTTPSMTVAGTTTLNGALDVNGALTISNGGTLTQGTNNNITISGNVSIASGGTFTKDAGTGTLTLDGDLTFTDSNATKQDMGNVKIGTSPDTTDLASDFAATSLTVNALDIFNTNGYEVDIGSGGITIAATGTFDATDDVETDTTQITVEGSWTNDGTFVESDSKLTFDGSAASTFDSGCATASSCTSEAMYDVTLNKTNNSDTVTLSSTNLRVLNTLTVTKGTLVQGALNVQVEGASAVSVAANGTWSNTSTGDLTLGGTFDNSGIVTFQGNGATCGDADDIAISSTSATDHNWTGAGTFNMNDITVSDQSSTPTITVYSGTNTSAAANWTFSGCPTTITIDTSVANTITVGVPNRYNMVMATNQTTDYILFKDRAQSDSSPNATYEFMGPFIREGSANYTLRRDSARITTVLEASSVRVRIRVSGAFMNEASSSYLTDGTNNILVTEEYTFTTEGMYVYNRTDFRTSGVILDSTGNEDGYNWLMVDSDVTDAAFDGTLIYGNGESQTTTTTDGAFEDTNRYVTFQGTSTYQSAQINIARNGWFDMSGGTDDWYADFANSGTQDRVHARERGTTPLGVHLTAWNFLILPITSLDTQGEREAVFTDFSNPDELAYTTGSKWNDQSPTETGVAFDGSEDFINVPNDSSFPTGTAVAVEAWVMYTGSVSDYVAILHRQFSTGDSEDYFLGLDPFVGTGRWVFLVRSSAGQVLSYDDTNMVTNVWYHLAGTWDGTNVRMYVNGRLTDTDALSGSIAANSNPITLGAGTGSFGHDNFFPGKADEIRLWSINRSASDIQDNMYKQIDPATSGLEAYWHMNEGTYQYVHDATANNNDGTFGDDTTSESTDPLWTSGYIDNQYNDGEGAYTIDASGNQVEIDFDGNGNATSLLNGAVSPGATSITVDSTSGFADGGGSTTHYAYIDGDKFSYTDVNGTQFTGIPSTGDMGVLGHADNTLVSSMNRYKSVFKIRKYRLSTLPSSATLEGSALASGTDFNVAFKPFADADFYNNTGTSYTQIAAGGDTGDTDEYLYDDTNDYTLSFNESTDYVYFGSESRFTGVNTVLATVGSGSSPTFTWQYCSANTDSNTACDTWSTLTVTDTDSGAKNFTASGNFYFTDPYNWAQSQTNSGPTLYYIRGNLSSGSFSTAPIEDTIYTDIVLFQYLGTVSSEDQTLVIVPEYIWWLMPAIVVGTFMLRRKKEKVLYVNNLS